MITWTYVNNWRMWVRRDWLMATVRVRCYSESDAEISGNKGPFSLTNAPITQPNAMRGRKACSNIAALVLMVRLERVKRLSWTLSSYTTQWLSWMKVKWTMAAMHHMPQQVCLCLITPLDSTTQVAAVSCNKTDRHFSPMSVNTLFSSR